MKKFILVLCAFLTIYALAGTASAVIITDHLEFFSDEITVDKDDYTNVWYDTVQDDGTLAIDNIIRGDYYITENITGDDFAWNQGFINPLPSYKYTSVDWIVTLGGPDGFASYMVAFEVQLESPGRYTFVPQYGENQVFTDIAAAASIDRGFFQFTAQVVTGKYSIYASDILLNAEAVPEPSTMLLLVSGLAGLAGFRRKFRKK